MEGSGSGSGSGPAPFLLKTYEMVDDSSTEEIVSWSSTNDSFIVWNPSDFSRLLLPTFFKHNNFSSFIRQLNTYGFRKVHPERWEFANEDFVKDQKHRLKNIHRRKPIHSHTHPPGSVVDPERSAFEEQIEKLSHHKTTIESNIFRFKQHHSAAKGHLEDLRQRLDAMEKRQKYLLNFFEKALQNPTFVERISRKIESMDLLAYNKKRRLPQLDDHHLQPVSDSNGMEFRNISHQDFTNKLTLELSPTPTVSDINLVSCSTHSSNEDGESPHKMLSEGEPIQLHTTTFAPETAIELAEENGASFTFIDSCLSRAATATECPKANSLEPNCEEDDSYISCLLNLTLASSPLQVKRNSCPDRSPHIDCQEIVGKLAESKFCANDDKDSDVGASSSRNLTNEVTNLASSHETPTPSNNQGTPSAPVRVNDVFWEQFLTERPGCSDNEEPMPNYKANAYAEQDEGRSLCGISGNVVNMDHLTL
ncbi:heat stress transcription factor A-5-like [Abrus precatorius]|uniref:Heat stress transcription factor A-5-like n=1 Tax=Abrus precatorius TaxID=3816 RepID=A0A8B8JZD5_ABRPR|nr:heat stress transcription factor A-5-like [Abrus precatorius]